MAGCVFFGVVWSGLPWFLVVAFLAAPSRVSPNEPAGDLSLALLKALQHATNTPPTAKVYPRDLWWASFGHMARITAPKYVQKGFE